MMIVVFFRTSQGHPWALCFRILPPTFQQHHQLLLHLQLRWLLANKVFVNLVHHGGTRGVPRLSIHRCMIIGTTLMTVTIESGTRSMKRAIAWNVPTLYLERRQQLLQRRQKRLYAASQMKWCPIFVQVQITSTQVWHTTTATHTILNCTHMMKLTYIISITINHYSTPAAIERLHARHHRHPTNLSDANAAQQLKHIFDIWHLTFNRENCFRVIYTCVSFTLFQVYSFSRFL